MSWIPAAGTVRRIRGLHLAGHDVDAIADAALLDPDRVRALADMTLSPHSMVGDDVAFAVRAATAQLRSNPAADTAQSRVTRAYALAAGWVPLTGWDDVIAIDDPHADDALAAATTHMTRLRRRIALEDHEQAARDRASQRAYRARRKTPAA